jgi:putative ABC transport system ATP-binding protein
MGNTVLKAENITKTYLAGEISTEVLKGIDFTVERGEFVAVTGESGSGKSTLLYILAGIEAPSSGTVELLGQKIEEASDEKLAAMRRSGFSFVYQFDNLVPNLNVWENVTLPLELDGKKESEYKENAEGILEYLGLLKRAKNFPSQLSGGEQQRAALARALATSPEIVFLDEPTGSLDKERGAQVMEMLADINKTRGVTLVMVTHSAAHAAYAKRTVAVEDGKIKNA